MNNTKEIVDAVLEYTSKEVDWSVLPDKEIEMWFQFGIKVCELKDNKANIKEKSEAGYLRTKFLNKI